MFSKLLRIFLAFAFLASVTGAMAYTGGTGHPRATVNPAFVGTWAEVGKESAGSFTLNADGTVSAGDPAMAIYKNWCYEDGKLCLLTGSGQEVVVWADPFMDGYFWTGGVGGEWESLYARQ